MKTVSKLFLSFVAIIAIIALVLFYNFREIEIKKRVDAPTVLDFHRNAISEETRRYCEKNSHLDFLKQDFSKQNQLLASQIDFKDTPHLKKDFLNIDISQFSDKDQDKIKLLENYINANKLAYLRVWEDLMKDMLGEDFYNENLEMNYIHIYNLREDDSSIPKLNINLSLNYDISFLKQSYNFTFQDNLVIYSILFSELAEDETSIRNNLLDYNYCSSSEMKTYPIKNKIAEIENLKTFRYYQDKLADGCYSDFKHLNKRESFMNGCIGPQFDFENYETLTVKCGRVLKGSSLQIKLGEIDVISEQVIQCEKKSLPLK